VYAAFSPAGLRLITGSKDRTARVWDAASGEALSPPLRHSRDIQRVRFSSDGNRAVVIGASGSVVSWDLTPDGRPADVLVGLAEVMSCGRIDEKQARRVLDSKSLRSAWDKLQAVP
jgi:WD40 repeat protein